MINHDKKFVYLGAGKCATSSIANALVPLDQKKLKDRHFTMDQHYALNRVKPEEIPNDYFVFTFTRNPYPRLVSAWMQFKKDKDRPKWAQEKKYWEDSRFTKRNLTLDSVLSNFNEFIKYIEITNFHHWAKFSDIRKKFKIDFIGKVENLQEDFDIVCDRIGIPRKKIPHSNKTKHKHYTEYYDDETRQIVAKKYAEDIEYFGYEFSEWYYE